MYQPDTAQPNPLLSEKRNPYVTISTLEEGTHNSVDVKPPFVREERIDCSWDKVSTYRATAPNSNTDTSYFRNPNELAGTMPLLKRNGVNATNSRGTTAHRSSVQTEEPATLPTPAEKEDEMKYVVERD